MLLPHPHPHPRPHPHPFKARTFPVDCRRLNSIVRFDPKPSLRCDQEACALLSPAT